MAVEVLRHRFTVTDYHRMGEAGIFAEDDRVELIDGEVVQMTPIGSRHAGCVKRLNRLLGAAVGDRAVVAVQDPIALHPDSEPQPDLALLRPRADFYGGGHPGPADVWLVVEVADRSLAFDRGVKVPLYARAGVPELWIVDLAGDGVETYRRPAGGRYAEVQRLGRGQRLGCAAFPGLDVAVDDVLGVPS
jgi:Uma2 family endonuclease